MTSPLLPMRVFLIHLFRNLLIGVVMISFGLAIGMWGYHQFEHMDWIDAFVNAAMILSGMGPFGPMTTTGGKLFAGFYALFSGLTFIVIIGVIFSPVFKRFFHKIHLDS
jgi:hypothetical protein